MQYTRTTSLHRKGLCILFIVLGLLPQLLKAQNRAPSLYLNYQDNEAGDIIINTLSVDSPSPLYTYYCGLLWNGGQHAGGYCGMQEHPSGRNFIFSLWDDYLAQGQKVTHDYAHPNTQVDPFGGEGTGLRSINYGLPWSTGEWYALVSRAWSINNDTTHFGYWIYDEKNTKWHHLVTMNYPIGNLKFNTKTSSFIEDWLGNGWENRTIRHKNGWKRRSSNKTWIPFSSTYFDRVYPDNGTVNYINNYDGGVGGNNEYFFMSSGGTISPTTNPEHTTLYLPINGQNPGYPTGVFSGLQLNVVNDNLSMTWEVDTSKSPQFSYHFKVYDNVGLNGNPVVQVDSVKPHLRAHNLDLTSLSDGVYYVEFNIVDIFDNTSTKEIKSFTKGNLVSEKELKLIRESFVYPNPTQGILTISTSGQIAHVSIHDITGKQVLNGTNNSLNVINLSTGMYTVRVALKSGVVFSKQFSKK